MFASSENSVGDIERHGAVSIANNALQEPALAPIPPPPLALPLPGGLTACAPLVTGDSPIESDALKGRPLIESRSEEPRIRAARRSSLGLENYWKATINTFEAVPAAEMLRLTVPLPARLLGNSTLT